MKHASHSPRRIAPAVSALVLAVALLVLAVAVAGCGETSASGTDPSQSSTSTPVVGRAASALELTELLTLIMDWIPWVLDIPIDVAQAKGLYEKAGLTVRQIIPAGATDVVKFASTAGVSSASTTLPTLLMAVEGGAPRRRWGLMTHAPVGMACEAGLHRRLARGPGG